MKTKHSAFSIAPRQRERKIWSLAPQEGQAECNVRAIGGLYSISLHDGFPVFVPQERCSLGRVG